ncbi:MAG TPA: beta-glucosidase [Clostridiales bacterium]|nr:beta-glucosidase [Clostridiales bacterium]
MENYKNTALTAEERAQDLLSRLSLDQKISQLMCKMFTGSPDEMLAGLPHGVGEALAASQTSGPVEAADFNRRIVDAIMARTGGIPPVLQAEAISGLLSPGATSFPIALGLAATFEPADVRQMTVLIRKQMMAVGVRRALSPVMDIARDPRWGRMGETYGEDPALGAAMSVAFVSGLQGPDLTQGVAATGKHFLGYAMGEGGLNSASSSISSRDLREVYAKPFQAAISAADLQSVMNSYGTIDNKPVIISKAILRKLLRDEMKFHGVTVADYGSITTMREKRIAANDQDCAVLALQAGMEMECPNPIAYPHLQAALAAGELDESLIDAAVLDVLTVKFRLGLFENPYPRTDDLPAAYHDPTAVEHSLQLARKSVVLLKNDGILPLRSDVRKIAVIGPRGNSVRMMYGGYTSPAGMEMAMGSMLADKNVSMGLESEEYYPNSSVKRESPAVTQLIDAMFGPITKTVFAAVREKFFDADVIFEQGCDIAGDDRSRFDSAVELARSSDVVILAVGGKYGWGEPCTSGEGRDSSDIGLPGVQEELLKLLCTTGTPVVVVHGDTRPLSSKAAKEQAAAILLAWCPGQTGGQAVADVLAGDYNPAGRLPVTALEHAGQVPIYAAQKTGNLLWLDQRRPGFNSFSNGIQEPLWHFGEGLSYSRFEYTDFVVDPKAKADGEIHAAVTVRNIGQYDGEEVVQLYFADQLASMIRPVQELAGFSRIFLKAGEAKAVRFTMKVSQTAFLNEDMQWVVEKGALTLRVGASSQDIRQEAFCEIVDSAVVDGSERGFFASYGI